MSNKSVSERLKFWRAERPDEWTMDEFIRDAERLEQERNELATQVERLRECAIHHELQHDPRVAVEALQAIKRHMEVFDIFEASSVWNIANDALNKLEEIEKWVK